MQVSDLCIDVSLKSMSINLTSNIVVWVGGSFLWVMYKKIGFYYF